MLEVHNQTPFPSRLVPWLDPSGSQHAVVVVKATFVLERGRLRAADEQLPVRLADEHHGEPERSSVKYEADTAPYKTGTDVAFVATAHAASPAEYLDLQLVAGPLQRYLRVFGDRVWQRALGGFRPGAPRPFRAMPLVWERAFGGADLEAKALHERNPVGVGFVSAAARSLEGQLLPNVEDPHHPLERPGDRPAPAGVGFVSRTWPVRAKRAGTLDAAYQRERAPLLPLDFDSRYFHAAPEGWTSPRPFVGGERIWFSNVLPGGGAFDVVLPAPRLAAMATIRGERREQALVLDTVLVEPEAGRVELTLRTLYRVPKTILELERLRIREVAS